MLVQQTDVGLGPQRDVILVPALLAPAVPLLLLGYHLPPHLQQLLQLEGRRSRRSERPRGGRAARSPPRAAPLPHYHLLLALLDGHVGHVVVIILPGQVGRVRRLLALPLWGDRR